MNVLDLELGRKYWIGKHIMLRPHAGFKGVWNKQHLHNEYFISGGASLVTNPSGLYESEMKQSMKNDGLGIRAGMDAAWHFSRGFSFIGNFALTGLWQQFKVHRRDDVETPADDILVSSPIYVRDRVLYCNTGIGMDVRYEMGNLVEWR